MKTRIAGLLGEADELMGGKRGLIGWQPVSGSVLLLAPRLAFVSAPSKIRYVIAVLFGL